MWSFQASQDTLLVVIEACPHDGKPVPFFAQGPSAKVLREATTIWDVPTAIRHIISSWCQDPSCRNRRHDVISPPITPLKIIPRNVAVLRRTSRDTAGKSVRQSFKVDSLLAKFFNYKSLVRQWYLIFKLEIYLFSNVKTWVTLNRAKMCVCVCVCVFYLKNLFQN